MREMVRQLRMIGEWQRQLLPRNLPQPPGWQIGGHYAAGPWAGGDYYECLRLPDGRLLVLMADASDQGAPAAALVAMVRVVLHSCPLASGLERLPFCPLHETLVQPPHILLGHLNRVLVENSLEEQFLTAFAGILNPVGGTFHYANAGHPAPRWWRAADRTLVPLSDADGPPLGVYPRAAYHHRRVALKPGDLLVLYSDGLTAAQNGRGQLFGCGRLDDSIRGAADGGSPGVLAAVQDSLEDFRGGFEPEDDVTLLVLERQE